MAGTYFSRVFKLVIFLEKKKKKALKIHKIELMSSPVKYNNKSELKNKDMFLFLENLTLMERDYLSPRVPWSSFLPSLF